MFIELSDGSAIDINKIFAIREYKLSNRLTHAIIGNGGAVHLCGDKDAEKIKALVLPDKSKWPCSDIDKLIEAVASELGKGFFVEGEGGAIFVQTKGHIP